MLFKKLFTHFLFLITVLYLFTACFSKNTEADLIKISAAASLTDVLNEITLAYTERSGINFELNFASSSIGARQIKEGKDSSLFLSANENWVDYLDSIYLSDSKKVLLYNSLVVIAPLDSIMKIQNLEDLDNKGLKKIAMGDPSHVPAGIYARKSLEMNSMWTLLEKKIVGAIDVRAALSLAESGAVDCAIVYKSDALVSHKVKILYEIPSDRTPQIEYFICTFDELEKTISFYNYLFSSEAGNIFRKYGFKTSVEERT
ncbi:MAG: molybdate ABC transporter substrate-binding protein [Spirochaetaceae bacterium]|jgi:molybdate transport system substrate-binding protein|nr:molybdate ABC transporter substrate-binding protein [Spirochaetaceae bacterium]